MAELAELAPKGERRMGANPHANGGLLLKDLRLPDFRDYAVAVPGSHNVVLVDLEEGPRMMTNIVTDDVESVRIGQRVAVTFDAVTNEITLPKFKAA